jgi:hypothetical protein
VWRVPVAFGFLIWVATMVASGAVDYLAGYQFGRTPAEAQVFAVLGASADAWKALGPISIVALWRASRFVSGVLALLVWIVCFTFAVTAALGLVAQNRSALTSTREDVRASYAAIARSLGELKSRRDRIGTVPSPAEVRAQIAAALAVPLVGGTVGSLSHDCDKDVWRARVPCADVARLRQTLAASMQAARLDAEIAQRGDELSKLRRRGGTRDVDPQATLISRLTFDRIPAADVGRMIMLILVAMVEVISAFAPVVLREFIAVHRAPPQPVVPGRDESGLVAAARDLPLPATTGNLFEYLAGRVVPDMHGSVSEPALFSDYKEWCRSLEYVPLKFSAFAQRLDDIGARELGGRIWRKRKNVYGLRLATVQKRLAFATRFDVKANERSD